MYIGEGLAADKSWRGGDGEHHCCLGYWHSIFKDLFAYLQKQTQSGYMCVNPACMWLQCTASSPFPLDSATCSGVTFEPCQSLLTSHFYSGVGKPLHPIPLAEYTQDRLGL